ncbi:MAG: HAD-IIIA family hydrolase, partial [Methylococcales bacterium]|nr:HAD-IIIA family hydrolase [Methylococcales bacterium]
MKNEFDLIIFDWDGTLADSVDWIVHCLKVAADQQGLVVPEDQAIKNIIGLSIQNALAELFPKIKGQAQEQFIACYSQVFFAKTITENDLFLGVNEMLRQLRGQGYKLAVATGKGRSGLDKAMQGVGLLDFFDATRCANETASKPNPLMLEEIVTEMQVSKERVVFVGDSNHDLQMAENAGVAAIAVLCGANSKAQLSPY